ncbi:MAG: UDP-N-acetylglucosamine 2-epimerase [Dysosmobacter sp.]|nr:UDP-N-acetylglucosamine 2-epimerase [Dysosmobacter sp.]
MKKICTVVGARPQFIKLAVVSRVLRKRFREVLVHTGQHYDYNMSDVFFEEMDVPKPDYNLGVSGGSHGSITGQMLIKIEEILLAERLVWERGFRNILLSRLVGYQYSISLVNRAKKIVTDSGGLQREAFFSSYQPFGGGHSGEKIGESLQ